MEERIEEIIEGKTEENGAVTLRQLEHENKRLKKALKEIMDHQEEIRKLIDEVQDLFRTVEEVENAPVTEEDVKSLLKKYSRV